MATGIYQVWQTGRRLMECLSLAYSQNSVDGEGGNCRKDTEFWGYSRRDNQVS